MTERLPSTVSLPERDPTKPAEQQGLFRKFEVYRTDRSDAGPGCKHYGCDYFVLDTTHDLHAKAALAAYADAVEATHPDLAADMRARYSLASERDALAVRVRELEAALKEAIVIIDGALYCGHELNITGKEKLSRCRAALSLDTHHAASEPVAYLVTGPYVKQAFPDFSGASAFCSGLNEGFDEAAYIVRPLYTTPESKP